MDSFTSGYNLFLIIHEFHKIVSGSIPQIGFLLVWIYLATFVSPAPITFPSRMAKNHFEMSPDGSYLFFYDTGPGQHQSFREEKRTRGGTISGTYGYVDPLGVLHITEYVADSKGYRASIEVYEPVRQVPEGPTLIVGPLPTDLRSTEEKAQQESVFEKYEFPIEPFESLKIEAPSLIYSSVANKISNFPFVTTTTASSIGIKKSIEKEVSENDVESNGTSLTIDIQTLQKQLRSLSQLLHDDPLLLIGPLPGDLPKLLSLNNNDDETSSKSNRKFRSSSKHKKDSNDTVSSITNSTENIMNFINIPQSEYGVVIPDINELNYVEKDLVSKGEDISSFLTYPSSNLLQGGILSTAEKGNASMTIEKIVSDKNEHNTSHKEVLQTNKTEPVIELRKIIPSFSAEGNISIFKDKQNKNLSRENESFNDHQNTFSTNEIFKPNSNNKDENSSFKGMLHNNNVDNAHSVKRIMPSSFTNEELIASNDAKLTLLHEGTSSEDKEGTSLEENSGEIENIASEENSSLRKYSVHFDDIEKINSFDHMTHSGDINNNISLVGKISSDIMITSFQEEIRSPVDKEGSVISPAGKNDTSSSGRKSRLKKNIYRIKRLKLETKDDKSVQKDYIGY